ncbi:MAG: ATP-dependent RecD-like DNA helicase, partial [Nannocystaceae bacterium]
VHGKQFAFRRLTVQQPSTVEGIQRRLEKYPGLGKDKASKIVKRFGTDTLTLLDSQPSRFLEVPSIGQKTLDRVLAHHQSRTGPIAQVENLLIELDIPAYFADAIVQCYRDRAIRMVREHPYRLAKDVRGIGFLTADRIARATGVSLDSDDRVDAGLLYILERAENDGHCALPLDRLVQSSSRLLDQPGPRMREGVERLIASGDLEPEQRDEQTMVLLFPRHHVSAEQSVARMLSELAVTARTTWKLVKLPKELSPGQVAAVHAVARSGFTVLTGGPGTGKSTVTRQVIELAEANGEDLLLAAPTGRAAKRLAEATGKKATTIHRLLEIQGNTLGFGFNADNPLPLGLVIIDEASMLDLSLANALFSALTPEHRLLLVGDIDQLPSVGPGNVLRDIISVADHPDSAIPVVRLNQIFRQEEGSSIVLNAHRILSGERLESDSGEKPGQFYVIQARDAERAHQLVMRVAAERAPEAYGLDPRQDVQILCPMHKGRAGTIAFNRALQAQYTAGEPEVELPAVGRNEARIFRLGDRVMQTRNDHERNVFNGDVGVVVALNPDEKSLVVDVEGVQVNYDQKQLGALQLAYAVSIHKSQGSEFPAVIVPILGEHHVMLRRNLLYTAVTRAKKLCVVVGDPRALGQAIRRADATHRYTGLGQRLERVLACALDGSQWIDVDGA